MTALLLLVPPALINNNVVFMNTLGNRESVDFVYPTLDNYVVGIIDAYFTCLDMCLLLHIESTAFGLFVVVISMALVFYVTSSIAWLGSVTNYCYLLSKWPLAYGLCICVILVRVGGSSSVDTVAACQQDVWMDLWMSL